MRMIVVVWFHSRSRTHRSLLFLSRSNCMCVFLFFLHSFWFDTVKNAFDYISLSLSIILSISFFPHIYQIKRSHTRAHITIHIHIHSKSTHTCLHSGNYSTHTSIQLEFKIVVRPKNSYSQEKIFSSNRDLRRLTVPVRVLFPFSRFSLSSSKLCVYVLVWTKRVEKYEEKKNKQSIVHTVAAYAIAVHAVSSIKFSLCAVYHYYSCRGLISSYFAFICRGYIISILAYFAIDERERER